ncbi:hypothetical protein OAN96_01160 [Candidatus Gracilibacteria bacterium]|nr:hypothetical protein [Candidatus Gracilibacteria bacterium]
MNKFKYANARDRCITKDKLNSSKAVWIYVATLSKKFRAIHEAGNHTVNSATVKKIYDGYETPYLDLNKDFLQYVKDNLSVNLILYYRNGKNYQINWKDVANAYKGNNEGGSTGFPEAINQVLITVYNYCNDIEYNLERQEKTKNDIDDTSNIIRDASSDELLELFKEEILYRRSGGGTPKTVELYTDFTELSLQERCNWFFYYFSSRNNTDLENKNSRRLALWSFFKGESKLNEWWIQKISTRIQLIINNKPPKVREKFQYFLDQKSFNA